MKKKNQIQIISSILAFIIIFSYFSPIIQKEGGKKREEIIICKSAALGRIYINGDTELGLFQNKTGNGTVNDPYIIENFEIDAGGINSSIWIENVHDYLVIKNCFLNNSATGPFDSGIRLENCDNINITGCNITSNSYGIYLFSSDNINISNNFIFNNNKHGIWFSYSDNNKVINNSIWTNNETGIDLGISSFNIITKNEISVNSQYGINVETISINNSIYQNSFVNNSMGDAIDDGTQNSWDNGILGNYWENYSIIYPDASNDGLIWNVSYEINGSAGALDRYPTVFFSGTHEPIHIQGDGELAAFPGITGEGNETDPYMIDGYKITAKSGAFGIKIEDTRKHLKISNCWVFAALENSVSSGIHLDNCTNITIENCVSKYNSYGLYIVNSDENEIIDSTITDNLIYGMWVKDSDDLLIYNNTIGEVASSGIEMNDCFFNNITKNHFFNNSGQGVKLGNSHNNTIAENNATGCFHGSWVLQSSNNSFEGNNLTDNNNGIFMSQSTFNNFTGNYADSNNIGFYSHLSNNNTVMSNNFSNHVISGIKIKDSDDMIINANNFTSDYKSIALENAFNSTIYGNMMFDCSIGVDGTLEECASHTINLTNLVNGKQIYYYRNETGLNNLNFSNPGEIILVNCNDSSISDFILQNGSIGIQILYGENNTISNNSISFMKVGIQTMISDNFTIFDNIITSCHDGISLTNSFNMTLLNNSLYFGGYWIRGYGVPETVSLERFLSHDIDQTNKVNDETFFYYKNKSGLVPSNFSGAGQIMLVNCTDSQISNIQISNTSKGIILNFCKNVSISSNNITNCLENGILLHNSSDNKIRYNNISSNDYGIYLDFFVNINNDISNNNLTRNINGFMSYSGSNSIVNNSITENIDIGVIYYGTYANISQNNFTDNYIGLYLYCTGHSDILLNNISNNEYGIAFDSNTTENNIYFNNLINNSESNVYFYSSYFETCNNSWDNETTGNYWGDYQDRYPTANKTNNDTIWNIPYELFDITVLLFER